MQRFDMLFDPCLPVVLEPEPGATADEIAIIEEAIAMWGEVASIDATTEPVNGARRLSVSFPEDIWYYGRFDDAGGGLEVASWIGDSHGMAIVLAHELGHAFNLYHVEPGDRVSVMNAGNQDVPPTREDGEALAGLWGDCAARAARDRVGSGHEDP